MRITTPPGRRVAAAAGLALAVAVLAPTLAPSLAHAQSSDSSSNGGSAPGGEGSHSLQYGLPGMAGNLPLSGYAYNDGSR